MTIPKGWQPIAEACRTLDVSRQRIHQLIEDGTIPVKRVFGRRWIPHPLAYKPDREHQQRFKGVKKVLDKG